MRSYRSSCTAQMASRASLFDSTTTSTSMLSSCIIFHFRFYLKNGKLNRISFTKGRVDKFVINTEAKLEGKISAISIGHDKSGKQENFFVVGESHFSIKFFFYRLFTEMVFGTCNW